MRLLLHKPTKCAYSCTICTPLFTAWLDRREFINFYGHSAILQVETYATYIIDSTPPERLHRFARKWMTNLNFNKLLPNYTENWYLRPSGLRTNQLRHPAQTVPAQSSTSARQSSSHVTATCRARLPSSCHGRWAVRRKVWFCRRRSTRQLYTVWLLALLLIVLDEEFVMSDSARARL